MPVQYGTWFRLKSAGKAAFQRFRQVFNDPGEAMNAASFEERAELYKHLWSLYSNTIFEMKAADVDSWLSYRKKYNLYKHIRSIYNPVPRLVRFYSGVIYPGVFAAPGQTLPEGVPRAMQLDFGEGGNEPLEKAVYQLVQWSNWQAKVKMLIRYVAALGNTLVTINDNTAKGKVSFSIKWPGTIKHLSLDDSDNVQEYVEEYEAIDSQGLPYTFTRHVTRDKITHYRNGQPDGTIDNIYGFVPAVWVKFLDDGGDFGVPAVGQSWGKIDELNGLVSRIHDHIHRAVRSPRILWTSGRVTWAFDNSELFEDEASDVDETDQAADQTQYDILKGPEGGKTDTLVGTLQLAEALTAVDKIMAELNADFPELSFWPELRAMTQVHGPAARILTGDTALRVWEVAANFDTQLAKLFKMGVSVAAIRFHEGAEGWAERNAQQTVFKPFTEKSFSEGRLDFSMVPRYLIPETETEQLEAKKARADYASKVKEFVSGREVLRILKYTVAEQAQINKERSAVDPVDGIQEGGL